MKWYSGQIPDAIAKAKQQRGIFVVYISGDDEQSKQMEETLTDSAVTELCERERMVALRIPANSDTCKQFSAIYPVFCVPSTFFIGDNGTPLEVTGGHVPAEKFLENIQKSLKLHKEQQAQVAPLAPSAPAPGSAPSAPAPGSAPSASAPSSAPPAASPSAPAPEGESPAPAAATAPAPPIDDKVQRAKELVAQKQREKLEKEKEEQKKKERERRQLGQDMNRLKALQAEAEAKELKNQMKKDREEEKEARQWIKDQIARDREERAAKYQKEKQEKNAVKQEKVEAKATASSQEDAAKAAARLEHARIQFRLPDGSAITNQFSSNETLGAARDYLMQQIGNRLGAVELSVTYPKRTFTEQDMSQTLRSLILAPSAAIIVIPASRRGFRSSATTTSGNGGGMFAMIFAPFLAVWNFLMTFLFGAPARQVAPPPAATSPTEGAAPTAAESEGGARPKSSYGVRNRERRLHNLSDDDDDSATWNGNSTQQL